MRTNSPLSTNFSSCRSERIRIILIIVSNELDSPQARRNIPVWKKKDSINIFFQFDFLLLHPVDKKRLLSAILKIIYIKNKTRIVKNDTNKSFQSCYIQLQFWKTNDGRPLSNTFYAAFPSFIRKSPKWKQSQNECSDSGQSVEMNGGLSIRARCLDLFFFSWRQCQGKWALRVRFGAFSRLSTFQCLFFFNWTTNIACVSSPLRRRERHGHSLAPSLLHSFIPFVGGMFCFSVWGIDVIGVEQVPYTEFCFFFYPVGLFFLLLLLVTSFFFFSFRGSILRAARFNEFRRSGESSRHSPTRKPSRSFIWFFFVFFVFGSRFRVCAVCGSDVMRCLRGGVPHEEKKTKLGATLFFSSFLPRPSFISVGRWIMHERRTDRKKTKQRQKCLIIKIITVITMISGDLREWPTHTHTHTHTQSILPQSA